MVLLISYSNLVQVKTCTLWSPVTYRSRSSESVFLWGFFVGGGKEMLTGTRRTGVGGSVRASRRATEGKLTNCTVDH